MKDPLFTATSKDYNENYRYPMVSPAVTATAKTSTATLTAATLAGLNLSNTGAGGDIVLTLPAAYLMTNQAFTVTVLAAHAINLSPIVADAIWLNGSGVVNKDLVLASTAGTTARIFCDGEKYLVTSHTSAVTKEA